MRKRERQVFIAAALAFLLLAVFEPSYGWRIRQWLSAGAVADQDAARAAGAGGASAASAAALAAENESLKAELAVLQGVAAELPQGSPSGTLALVYSQYPFNFKSELLVSAGADEGVAAGDAATFHGVLVGTVRRVFPHEALVMTVFDDGFRMAARIGKSGYDTLLSGGASPRAESIVKGAAVAPGDIVYSAAPGIPYGMPIAIVQATDTSPDGLFEEASLGFAYDINAIRSVVIMRE